MEFRGEHVINDAGKITWHQGLRITDESLKLAYRQNTLIEFIIETSGIMGVAVGMA